MRIFCRLDVENLRLQAMEVSGTAYNLEAASPHWHSM